MPTDDPPVNREKTGHSDSVILSELGKDGVHAQILNEDDTLPDADLLIVYNDTWRWDFKKIPDNLEISFYIFESEQPLVTSTFSIGTNKELHRFPHSEKNNFYNDQGDDGKVL